MKRLIDALAGILDYMPNWIKAIVIICMCIKGVAVINICWQFILAVMIICFSSGND